MNPPGSPYRTEGRYEEALQLAESFAYSLRSVGDVLHADEWDEDWDWYPAVDFSPSWSLFFNAGRGWSLSDPASAGYFGPDTRTFADVGVGFLFGDIGLYWAYPLHGDDRNVNFFLRIDHRF